MRPLPGQPSVSSLKPQKCYAIDSLGVPATTAAADDLSGSAATTIMVTSSLNWPLQNAAASVITRFANTEAVSSRGIRNIDSILQSPYSIPLAFVGSVMPSVNRASLSPRSTRPYETQPGQTDRAYRESVDDMCRTIEQSCSDTACQMHSIVASLLRARDRFHSVSAVLDRTRPLIGIVGEIYCRLNTFSNQDLVRRLEAQGAECWMSDIAEWIAYTNMEEVRNLKLAGRPHSWAMLKSLLRSSIQRADEHALRALFAEEFSGYGEPSLEEALALAHAYLPFPGAEGEMVMNMGRSAYLAKHGVDGILDISPFTCMNGVVSEAIYPKLSRDFGEIPIRNFYFDGQQSDLDRDLGMFLDMARSYRDTKPFQRLYPSRFLQLA